jgi:large subunit ribosomal protein L22
MTASRPHVQSVAKFVRVSPRKARLVADHIRGRSVPEARTILAFTTRAAAREIEKVLRSAIANAESNPNLHWNGDDLAVAAVFVDEGPTIKRFQARARGRVSPIFKRTCHITIRVDQLAPVTPGTKKAAATPAKEQKPKADSKPKAKRTTKKKEAVAS